MLQCSVRTSGTASRPMRACGTPDCVRVQGLVVRPRSPRVALGVQCGPGAVPTREGVRHVPGGLDKHLRRGMAAVWAWGRRTPTEGTCMPSAWKLPQSQDRAH